MGLGQCLSEARRHDPATARLLTDSLWEYHPPGGAALPRELNVTLLPVSWGCRRDVGGRGEEVSCGACYDMQMRLT
jgi:hypothetical protein